MKRTAGQGGVQATERCVAVARRILIIGCPGAGKSTLAARLATLTGLPLISLDREFWQPGWQETPTEQWRARVAALAAGERWIIEGNYGASLDLRLPRADLLVWLDPPRRVCMYRALRRSLLGYGRTRPDMAPGCPERIDPEFFRYIWTFAATQNPLVHRMLAAHGRHLAPVIIRRDGEAHRFLASVAPDPNVG